MRKIRQGQTRWRLTTICGPDGHANLVYMHQCYVTKVDAWSVEYFDGEERRRTSHWAWLHSMYPTQRKAMREAWRQVRETDRVRNEEYAGAWNEDL